MWLELNRMYQVARGGERQKLRSGKQAINCFANSVESGKKGKLIHSLKMESLGRFEDVW